MMQNICTLRSFVPALYSNMRLNLPILNPALRLVHDYKTKPCQCVHRKICTSSIKYAKQEEDSVFKKILKKMGWTDLATTRRKVTAYFLYENVADKLDYEYFFKVFNMPDTFNSWFLITELHVWILLVRSMAEGCEKDSYGRVMRNNIVEALWADVATRSKQLGVNSTVLRKQIQTLSEQFQYALIGYDEGLESDMILAAAIWRRIFERQCDDPELIEKLVIYVRKQIAFLDKIPSEEFLMKRELTLLRLDETT